MEPKEKQKIKKPGSDIDGAEIIKVLGRIVTVEGKVSYRVKIDRKTSFGDEIIIPESTEYYE